MPWMVFQVKGGFLLNRKEAVAVAMEAHGNTVLRVAWSYMRNQHDAEDLFQDVFLKYFHHAHEMESPEHTKAWLIRVTGNLAKNRLKSKALRTVFPLEDADGMTQDDREDHGEVTEAVARLPVKYREVLHLYYYEGYPTKDIAALLGKPDATIRSLLKRGRGMVETSLKGAYDHV